MRLALDTNAVATAMQSLGRDLTTCPTQLRITMETPQNKVKNDLSYSVRRFYVDRFFIENIKLLPSGSEVLDIGGSKVNKRGLFNIADHKLEVKYLNISEKREPDILGDAANIAVKSNSFDGAILAEVLEHVINPETVLKEAHRILKKDGVLFITTPFLVQVHGDPDDYLRYTASWYKQTLTTIGFEVQLIERQGGFFSVLTNLLKNYFNQRPINSGWLNFSLRLVLKTLGGQFLDLDKKADGKGGTLLNGCATGYGIICLKK